MEQTITVRFVCDILDWNLTDIQLSHNFPTLAPLAPNPKPQLDLTFTMGNTQAISNDFYLLSPPQQQEILEECMDNVSISWAAVSSDAVHRINDTKFLVNSIESHKNGTTALSSTPIPSPDGKKCAKILTSPVRRANVFQDRIETPEQRKLYTQFMHTAEMNPAPPDAPATTAAGVNTMDGNNYKDTAWANTHLALTSKANLVCTSGPGISSYYSNPTKAVLTQFNWHNIPISENELSNIKYIASLMHPELLAASVQEAFRLKGVAMKRGDKDFADLFACTDPEFNPILIVAVAKVHAQYEKDKAGTPGNENFTVLLLLFQSEPHVCLPFSNTSMNLHLGTMIRQKDYKKNGTFDKYMRKNVNHKLVPIQNIPVSNRNIERELHFKAYYTTSVANKRAA